MTLKERLDWLLRMALLVFILAGAAFLSAITAMRFAIHGREVEMPNLVGKSVGDAQAILAGRGLGLRVADRVYNDLPLNFVVRQSPSVGVHMKVTQNAHVVLSLGRRQVTVPELEGKTLRAARIELLRSGLQVGEISSFYQLDFPADAIVLQDPRSGGGAASPRVNLLVSQGPREPAFVMPSLVGQNQVEAQRQLGEAGLHLVKIIFAPAPASPRGAVIEQTPPLGAKVTASTAIELKVAD